MIYDVHKTKLDIKVTFQLQVCGLLIWNIMLKTSGLFAFKLFGFPLFCTMMVPNKGWSFLVIYLSFHCFQMLLSYPSIIGSRRWS